MLLHIVRPYFINRAIMVVSVVLWTLILAEPPPSRPHDTRAQRWSNAAPSNPIVAIIAQLEPEPQHSRVLRTERPVPTLPESVERFVLVESHNLKSSDKNIVEYFQQWD
jgi:hypothetical protein